VAGPDIVRMNDDENEKAKYSTQRDLHFAEKLRAIEIELIAMRWILVVSVCFYFLWKAKYG
jgi:hypothetical protein